MQLSFLFYASTKKNIALSLTQKTELDVTSFNKLNVMNHASFMPHPSSVSLIMSHISIFKVQSSLCREPSVALSMEEQKVN